MDEYTAERPAENISSADGGAEEAASVKLRSGGGILYFLFMTAAYMYYETVLRIFSSQLLWINIVYPLLFGAAAGLAFAAFLAFFPRKAIKIGTGSVLFLTGIVFATECLIKGNFQTYMGPNSVFTGIGGVMKQYGKNLAAAIISGIPQIILFFVPVIIFLILGEKLMKKMKLGRKLALSLSAAVCAAGIFAVGAYLVNSGDESGLYSSDYSFDAASETFGLSTGLRLYTQYEAFGKPQDAEFVFETVASLPQENEVTETAAVTTAVVTTVSAAETEISEETEIPPEPEDLGVNVMTIDFDAAVRKDTSGTAAVLNQYVQSLTPSDKNEYTGIFKGKNLILICAEAFSDCVVDEQLTPTLYRMSHNGIYFSEYYQPTWGGSTTTGEFSFVMGLVPKSGLDSMKIAKDNNNYFTLGNQLQRLGYNSCAFHNGQYEYYDRNLTHPALGYDDYIAFGHGLEEMTKKYAEDSAMVDGTINFYLDKQPFSLYYMTGSGHFSYTQSNYKVTQNIGRVNDAFGDRYKDTTKYYFCYQLELEKAMDILIKKLEDAGIADDTVICVTSDHYPYGLEAKETFGNTEDYVTDLYGYKHTTPWEKDRNAWLLWSGCLENEYKDLVCEVSSPTYSLDIVPTLSNLFGLEYDSRLLVGRDVFSDAEPLALWNNYSWVTERGYYNYSKRQFTPKEGYEYDKEYIDTINGIVKNKILFSYKTVENDYYGLLFGEDEIK